ncbi:aminoglycoside 6-adenylyltransferase [Hujiaoplasma nucleasis]|uniref:Aminoglycoside 6-adenylyltransferase n=1 Tax=Hujiaoplasma nucleasis TaxID=2725268 RepID=A0A7L6N387_9MOLU|nr:aminoglycoside 6-adenylyltransferase [Hujiaoplasma nucleasis]QLY40633.1 aminoglycoside 6-adenylyltransferase [Hujiaoplasma nucleasis]
MNKHEQLLEKVIKIAKDNIHIRVLEMNGSRVNPNIEPDDYQDFDMVFYVDNYPSFIEDESWLNVFDKPLLRQTTKDQRDGDANQSFIYMMQFENGARLDLSICDVKELSMNQRDSLSVILIDKDNYQLEDYQNESSYYIQTITEKEFNYSCNEFYWLIPYVSKGIKRKQYFYAHKHLQLIRKELELMLDWWIGDQKGFNQSVGKAKSRYKDLLDKDIYQQYIKTYTNLEEKNLWQALEQALNLYHHLALHLSNKYKYPYQKNLKDKVLKFIKNNY